MMWNSGLIEVILSIPVANNFVRNLHEQSSRFHFTFVKPEDFLNVSADQWGKTDILITDWQLPAVETAPNLKWVQFYQDYDLESINEFHAVSPNLVFTSAEGVDLFEKAAFCIHQLTTPAQNDDGDSNNKNLFFSTVGIIGYDSLGRELARVLKAFQCTVLASTFNAMNPAATSFQPQESGDPAGMLFDRLYPMQALPSMLQECDFVVNTLTLSINSANLISEEVAKAMRPSSVFVDASHEGVTNYETILSLLEDKEVRVSALSENFIGSSQETNIRFLELIQENLRRYLDKQTLLNIIA